MHVVFFLYVYLGVIITYSGLFFQNLAPVLKATLPGSALDFLCDVKVEAAMEKDDVAE